MELTQSGVLGKHIPETEAPKAHNGFCLDPYFHVIDLFTVKQSTVWLYLKIWCVLICFFFPNRHGICAPGLLTASVRPVHLALPGVSVLPLWHIQTHLHRCVRSQAHQQEPTARPHFMVVCIQVRSLWSASWSAAWRRGWRPAVTSSWTALMEPKAWTLLPGTRTESR